MSGTVGDTTLTVEQMPGHNHQVNAAKLGISGMNRGEWANIGNLNITTTSTGGSQSHTHGLSGESEEASSLPPYYALSYIMRIA